jgi:hypothetical protein
LRMAEAWKDAPRVQHARAQLRFVQDRMMPQGFVRLSLEAVIEGVNALKSGTFPSFEEGTPRRSNKCNATLRNRRGRGGQNPCFHRCLTSPAAPC